MGQRLNNDLKIAGDRIVELQNEVAELTTGYQAQLALLEHEDQIKTEWAREASANLEAKCRGARGLRKPARCGRGYRA